MSRKLNNPHGVSLSKEVIADLKAKGLNQSEIADEFGVSKQAVSWHWVTYDGDKTTRQIVADAWPWATQKGHDRAIPFRRLRDHGEFMRTGGEGMNADKLHRLKRWWKKLRDENLVVEFDPNIKPIPGVAAGGGFAYRQRTVEDDDLLIRANEYTNITPEGEVIWAWPPDIEDLI